MIDAGSAGIQGLTKGARARALILLVINEYYSEHPIVNLKLFKDRTFTSGSTVMFFVFLNLFGSRLRALRGGRCQICGVGSPSWKTQASVTLSWPAL